jgi:SAM-dependent methyltransferase
MEKIQVSELVNQNNFDEAAYLAANPDVASAVKAGAFTSGRQHFEEFGLHEARKTRSTTEITRIRSEKVQKLIPNVSDGITYEFRNGKLNFLTDELKRYAELKDTDAVSENSYDERAIQIINSCTDGLILDCGSGRRDVYFSNVINYEIVDYDTTDFLGIGEILPFNDSCFDAVISIAVLEHVKDPFRCASELVRVLKLGGVLYCCVPFLQPLHGYPNHYFNMTHQGLASLFSAGLKIEDQDVLPSTAPIWSLTWILDRWASQLPPADRDQFVNLKLGDLLKPATNYLEAGHPH